MNAVQAYVLANNKAKSAVSGVDSMEVEGQDLIINTKDSGQLTMTFPDPIGLQFNWIRTALGVKREDESSYQYVNLKGKDGVQSIGNFNIQYGETVLDFPNTGDEDTLYIETSTNYTYRYNDESGTYNLVGDDVREDMATKEAVEHLFDE